MHYYPIYLDLKNRLCVIFGGGAVALEKAEGLLEAGAHVRIIAPELTQELDALIRENSENVEYLPRTFQPGDTNGVFMVFAERLPEADAIFREADANNVPVNVQDDTPRCSFIAASIVRRGDLTITISTSGKAPALAVRLRQQLERQLGHHLARFLELAGRIRDPLLARYPDFETRKKLWYQLVDSDVLELLKRGDEGRARQRMSDIMGVPS